MTSQVHGSSIGVEEGRCGSFEDIEHAIMQLSWLGQRQFMHLLDSKRFRITLPQFHTLFHLHQMDGECKMSDLADATHQSAASLTGVVDRLLEKQLVARTRDPRDRRQVMVILTPLGSTLIDDIKQARYQQMQSALANLKDEDVHTLVRLLDRALEGMMRVFEHEQNGCI